MIHLSARSRIYRGRRVEDGAPVIIRQVRSRARTEHGLARLRRDYVFGRALEGCAIRRAIESITLDGLPALVYEDEGGVPMRRWLESGPHDLDARLAAALAIAQALSSLHDCGITHRDLTPDHVLLDVRGEARLLDLGVATLATRGIQPAVHPRELTGDLRYLAPELTGRSGRAFDMRADLYALGGILFELFAGGPPFDSPDSLELAQAQLARTPKRLVEVAPEVPTALSRVVARLLEKCAEDRYQGIDSLVEDLGRILAAHRQGRSSADLVPDAASLPVRFSVPARTYGREVERRLLFAELERAIEGSGALVVLSGPVGVGKSMLVGSVISRAEASNCKRIHLQGGIQDGSDRYLSVIESMAPLLQRFDAAEHRQRNVGIARLRDQLGASASVLAQVLPGLARLMPDLAPAVTLPPAESEQRLELAFVRLLRALVSPLSPLLLVIEDCDHLDVRGRRLLGLVTGRAGVQHLLVIGTTPASGPELDALRASFDTDSLQVIDVAPLDADETAQMVCDTLRAAPDDVQETGARIHARTAGIPSRILAELDALRASGELCYEPSRRRWQLRPPPSGRAADADVLPGSASMERFPEPTRLCLEAAATIGREFDLRVIAEALSLPVPAVLRLLMPTLRDGLLAPVGAGQNEGTAGGELELEPAATRIWRVAFVDHATQETVYQGLDESRRAHLHLQIGNQLLAVARSTGAEHALHEGVAQLNLAHQLSPELGPGVIALARLNLEAGHGALDASRPHLAFRHLRTGLGLLGSDAWQDSPALALELSSSAMDAAALCGDPGQVERLGRAALAHPMDTAQRLRIAGRVTAALVAEGRSTDAFALAVPALTAAGMSPVSRQPLSLLVARALLSGRRLLAATTRLPAPDRPALPELTAGSAVLLDVVQGAVHAAPRILLGALLRLLANVRRRPDLPETPYALACCGALCALIGLRGDAMLYRRACESALAAPTTDPRCAVRSRLVLACYVEPWLEPPVRTLQPLLELHRDGLAIGDVETAGYAASEYAVTLVVQAQDLLAARRELTALEDALQIFPDVPGLDLVRVYAAFIDELQGSGDGSLLDAVVRRRPRSAASGARIDPAAPADETPVPAHLAMLHGWRLLLRGEPERALERLDQATPLASAPGYAGAQLHLLRGLAELDVARTAPRGQRAAHRRRARRSRERLDTWSAHGLAHVRQRVALLDAEEATLLGRHRRALRRFEEAVTGARNHGFGHDEALTWQRAARACRDAGRAEFADRFIDGARAAWRRVGAPLCLARLPDRRADPEERPRPAGATTRLMESAADLAGQVQLDALAATLLERALDATGASHAALILREGDRLELTASAAAGTRALMHGPAQVLGSGTDQVPVSMIQFASRSGEPIVLADARAQDAFAQDPYLVRHRSRSVVALPMVVADRPIGVFYAEHPERTGLFSGEVLESLRLLTSQAAIGIENSRLYDALARARDEFRGLFENAAEGIFRTSIDGRLQIANKALAEALGYDSPDELLSEIEYLPRDVAVDPEAVPELLARICESSGLRSRELEAFRRDGTRVWLELSARAVGTSEGAMRVIEGSLIDVTARRARLQAEQDREVAEAATDAKSNFLASMSHEIRTPMNAIVGFAELALSTDLTPKQREWIANIHDAGGNLLGIINDILDLSRIEAGRLELTSEPLDPVAMLQRLESLFGIRARAQRVLLAVQGAQALAAHIPPGQALYGDPVRLRQVLVNLTDNALKFTPEGRVDVIVEVRDSNPDSLALDWTVRDTGIGIAEADRERLFVPFEQLDSGTTRQRAGTGLGLAISRQIIDLMGGTLTLDSRPGMGSSFRFSVRLPLGPAPDEQAAASADLQPLAGRSILLAEDNRINQQLALEFLESAGAVVSVKETGQEVVEALRAQAFDAVLMDLHMPGMDGIEACRVLRRLEHGRSVPVIAVTADALGDGILRAREAGFDAYVLKPVDRAGLIGALLRFLPTAATAAAPADAVAVPARPAGLPGLPGLDLGRALHSHNDRPELLRSLLGEFQAHYGDAGARLRECLVTRRPEEAARLAHNLHGVAGSFGAERLRLAAGDLERAIERGETRLDGRIASFEQALQEALESAARISSGEVSLTPPERRSPP